MRSSTSTTPSSICEARHAVEQREIGLLAEREHERVGRELLGFAGRLREAALVEHHLLEHQFALVGMLDGGEPLHQHALLECFLHLEVVGGHRFACAAVDDDRLARAEALGGARRVHRRVAAAVDDDAAAEQRSAPRPPCRAAALTASRMCAASPAGM